MHFLAEARWLCTFLHLSRKCTFKPWYEIWSGPSAIQGFTERKLRKNAPPHHIHTHTAQHNHTSYNCVQCCVLKSRLVMLCWSDCPYFSTNRDDSVGWAVLLVCVCCGTEFSSTKELFSSLNKVSASSQERQTERNYCGVVLRHRHGRMPIKIWVHTSRIDLGGTTKRRHNVLHGRSAY